MKIPIEECPACREIDAKVAEVRGHIVAEFYDRLYMISDEKTLEEIQFGLDYGINCFASMDGTFCLELPKYSGYIEAAWKLAEVLRHTDNRLTVGPSVIFDSGWAVQIGNGDFVQGETASLSITRAFLKTYGITEVEVPGEFAREWVIKIDHEIE